MLCWEKHPLPKFPPSRELRPGGNIEQCLETFWGWELLSPSGMLLASHSVWEDAMVALPHCVSYAEAPPSARGSTAFLFHCTEEGTEAQIVE